MKWKTGRKITIVVLFALLTISLVTGITINYAAVVEPDFVLDGNDMATKWATAIYTSIQEEREVRVRLDSDWVATDGDFYTSDTVTIVDPYQVDEEESQVEVEAFKNGQIYVPAGAKIVLDLNHRSIDRGLVLDLGTSSEKEAKARLNGSVILVEGSLTVRDDSIYADGTIKGGFSYKKVMLDGSDKASTLASMDEQTQTLVNEWRYIGSNDRSSETYHLGNGGGVHVYGESANFTLIGGIITGNYAATGGGVCVDHYANFEMYGGIIQNNEVWGGGGEHGGGGLAVVYGATASMYSGSIDHNYASYLRQSQADGMGNWGGGVLVWSTAAINESNNFTTWNNSFSDGKKDSQNRYYVFRERAGQTCQSVFNMFGGDISNNQTNFLGAGIAVVGGGIRYTPMSGVTSFLPNDSRANGSYDFSFFTNQPSQYNYAPTDTECRYSVFNMNGGSLTNNVAQKRSGETAENLSQTFPVGGGVAVFEDGAFIMNGGDITSNFCQNGGAGVGLTQGGSNAFVLNKGTIASNRAGGGGAGVALSDWNDYFFMYGGKITGNIGGIDNTMADRNHTRFVGAGVNCSGTGKIYLSEMNDAIQIYGNYVYYNKDAEGSEQSRWLYEFGEENIANAIATDGLLGSDVYLGINENSNQIIEVGTRLMAEGKTAQIGVTVGTESPLTGNVNITNGYGEYNKTDGDQTVIPPSTFFFSNNSDLPYIVLNGNEASLVEGSKENLATVIWQYQVYGSTQWVTLESNGNSGAVNIDFTFYAGGNYQPSGVFNDGAYLVLDPEDGVPQRKRISNIRGYVVMAGDPIVNVYYWKDVLSQEYDDYRGDDYLLEFLKEEQYVWLSGVNNQLINGNNGQNGALDFNVLEKGGNYDYLTEVDTSSIASFISGAGTYSFVIYSDGVIYEHPSLVVTINQNEQSFNWALVNWDSINNIYTFTYDGKPHVPDVYTLVNGQYIYLNIPEQDKPTQVGTYALRITVNDSYTDQNYKLSFNNNGAGSIELVRNYQILPREINAPNVSKSHEYTGEVQLPNILHNADEVLGILGLDDYSELYAVEYFVGGISSSGITNVGQHLSVVITLLDSNTVWKADSISHGVISQDNKLVLTYDFTIDQAHNGWVVEFHRDGWTYGDEPTSRPEVVEPRFGEATVVYYQTVDDKEQGEFYIHPIYGKLKEIVGASALGTHAGIYYARVTVPEPENKNYFELESWYTIEIRRAKMDTPTIPNYIYNGAEQKPDLTAFEEEYKKFLAEGENGEVHGYGVVISTHNGGNTDAYGMYTVTIKLKEQVLSSDIDWNANGGVWDDDEQALKITYTVSRRKVTATLSGSGVFNGVAQNATVTFTDLLEENENVAWVGGVGNEAFDTLLKTHYMVEYYYHNTTGNSYDKVLSALHKGTYKGKVALTSTVANNYIIVSDVNGYDYGSYEITVGENSFTRHFSRDGWTQYHEVPTTDRLPIAKYGDSTQIEVTYWTGNFDPEKPSDVSGLTQFTGVFSRSTAAGTYWVKVFVPGEKTYGDYGDIVDWHKLVINEASHELTSFGTYIINSQDGVNNHARTCKVEGCPYRLIEECTEYNKEYGLTEHWEECVVCGHTVNSHSSMFTIDTSRGGQIQFWQSDVTTSSDIEAGWLWKQLENGSFHVTIFITCEGCDFVGTRSAMAVGVPTSSTCTEHGSVVYSAGLLLPYGDGERTFETSYTAVGTDPTGHRWVVNVGKADTTNGWVLGDNKTSSTLYLICETCNQEHEVMGTANADNKVPANCVTKTNGYTPYKLAATVQATDEQSESLNRFTSKDTFVGATDNVYSAIINVEGTDDADDYNNVHSWEYTSLTGEGSNHTHVKQCAKCKTTEIETGSTTEKPDRYVQPTCDTPGYKVYECSLCGYSYQEEDESAQATGHSWNTEAIEWSWNGHESATATIKCSHNDSHTMTVEAEISAAPNTATCTAGGKIVYTAKATFEGVAGSFTNSTEEDTVALGHVYQIAENSYTWSTDEGVQATLKLVCQVCQSGEGHELEIVLSGADLSTQEHSATCEADGYTVYTVNITLEDLASKVINGKLADGIVLPTNSTQVAGASKLGHSYKLADDPWSWMQTGGSWKAVLHFECSECNDELDVVANVTSTTQSASCHQVAITTYTATIDSDTLSQAKKTSNDKFYNDSDEITNTLTDTYVVYGSEMTSHSYSIQWSDEHDDPSQVTAKMVCDTCGNSITLQVTVNTTVIEATCTANGSVTYEITAYYNGTTYTYANASKYNRTSEKTGHSYKLAGNAWTWGEEYNTVTLHLVCEHDALHTKEVEVGSQYITSETKDPTSTASGYTTYTVTLTVEQLKTLLELTSPDVLATSITDDLLTNSYVVPGEPALDHNWQYSHMSEEGSTHRHVKYCTDCDAMEIEECDMQPNADKYVSATCDTPGYKVYECSLCGYSYQEEDESAQATGHAWNTEAIEWSWNGHESATATIKCSHNDSHTMTVEAEISAAPNTATCTEGGKIIYTAKATFEGVAGSFTNSTEEVTVALGHSWQLDTSKGEDGWSWTLSDNGYESAVAHLKCNNCDETHDVVAEITDETITGSDSCNEPHQVKYKATANYDGKVFISTRQLSNGTNDHTWGTPQWIWEDNYTSAKLVFTCERCGTNEEHVAFVMSTTVEATCKDGAYTHYTAVVNVNGQSYQTSKDVTIGEPNSNAHNWSAWSQTKAPTCSKQGEEQRTCSICEKTETRSVDKIAHSFNSPSWTWSDDNSKATAQFTCTVCGHVQTSSATVTSEITDNIAIYTATVVIDGKQYATSNPVSITSPVEAKEKVDFGPIFVGIGAQIILLIIGSILISRRNKKR